MDEKNKVLTLENYFHILGSGNNDNRFYDYIPNFEQKSNAEILLGRMNEFLREYRKDYPDKNNIITSGYRPDKLNDKISRAKQSRHELCQAVDLLDDDDKTLGIFCLSAKGIDLLKKLNLWIEDPAYTTKTNKETKKVSNWVHFQMVPPKSGNRVYKPF